MVKVRLGPPLFEFIIMFYGVTDKNVALNMILEVCEVLSPATYKNASKLLIGTCCAETAFCSYRDGYEPEGRGAFQFDSVRFKDVREYILNRNDLKQTIRAHWGIDFNLVGFGIAIDYSFLVSAIACRVGYMMISEPIPDTLNSQAKYWKKYWNSSAGKGTPEHYVKMYKKFNPIG